MRRTLGGVTLLVIACGACAGAEPRPEATRRELFDVRVPYVATLGYLMRLGVRPRRDPTIGAAFHEAARRPEAARFQRHRGIHNPWYSCAASSDSVERLAQCFGALLVPADRAHAADAVADYDLWLRRLWPRWRGRLQTLGFVFDQRLNEDDTRDLAASILRVANVSGRNLSGFPVLVVQQSPGKKFLYGQHLGDFVFVYSTDGTATTHLMGTVLHEFAHYAFGASDTQSMEARFARYGIDGVIAGNHWNEAMATYFGVVARRHFNISHDMEARWYGSVVVDGMARSLYDLWGERPSGVIGPALADMLVQIVRGRFPAPQRNFHFLLGRRVVVTEERKTAISLARSMGLHTDVRTKYPLPAEFPRDDDLPPTVSTVIFATYEQARTHTALLAGADRLPRNANTQRTAMFFGMKQQAPLIVVLAPDQESLEHAASRLPRVRLPRHFGWWGLPQ